MLPIESAFKVFTDRNGKPLENGYVYFGQPNLNPITSPITVYWDAAGTQPAVQPLRTVNGYIMRSGTPANIFIDVAYSQLVQDSKKRQVFYARTSDDFSIATYVIGAINNFIASILAPVGASLMGWIQYGLGAVGTTVEAKLRERKSIFDFMTPALKAVATGGGAYTAQNRTDMLVACNAAWASALLNRHDLYFPAGLYEIDDANFPWRQSVVVSLLDCLGLSIIGEGPATIFSTVSPDGADVFQLNGLKNFNVIGFPTLTASLTGTAGSGSNGCSVTSGYDNLYLEISPNNCQGIDKTTFIDGGKGLSIQCSTATLEVGTLRAKVRAKDCSFGFDYAGNLFTFLGKKVSIDVEYESENCYTGCNVGNPAATGAIPAGTHGGINVHGMAINCQKDLTLGRVHGIRASCQIITTKTAAERRLDPRGVAWFAADTTVEALLCTYAKNSTIKVSGFKSDCDYKYRIGGTPAGASGLNGATEYCDITLDVGGTAAITEFFGVNSGGNTARLCKFNATATGAASIPALLLTTANQNVSKIDGVFKGTFVVTLAGVTVSTTGNATYSINGNLVTVSLPALSGTSNSATGILTGIPAEIWPAALQYVPMIVTDNGVTVAGRGTVSLSGAITLNQVTGGALTSVFTAAGSKGISDICFSYPRF